MLQTISTILFEGYYLKDDSLEVLLPHTNKTWELYLDGLSKGEPYELEDLYEGIVVSDDGKKLLAQYCCDGEIVYKDVHVFM